MRALRSFAVDEFQHPIQTDRGTADEGPVFEVAGGMDFKDLSRRAREGEFHSSRRRGAARLNFESGNFHRRGDLNVPLAPKHAALLVFDAVANDLRAGKPAGWAEGNAGR